MKSDYSNFKISVKVVCEISGQAQVIGIDRGRGPGRDATFCPGPAMAGGSSSAAWRSGLERRFYDDHDRKVNGSIPNLVSLLRPIG